MDRRRSAHFVARSNPQRFLLTGIPPTFWARCRTAARKEHETMRTLILGLLQGWLLARDPSTQIEKAQKLFRQAVRRERPDLYCEYQAMLRRRRRQRHLTDRATLAPAGLFGVSAGRAVRRRRRSAAARARAPARPRPAGRS